MKPENFIRIRLSVKSYHNGERGNCFLKEMDLTDSDEIYASDDGGIFKRLFEGIELNDKELLEDALKLLKDRIKKTK
jgi:hypothetical protein